MVAKVVINQTNYKEMVTELKRCNRLRELEIRNHDVKTKTFKELVPDSLNSIILSNCNIENQSELFKEISRFEKLKNLQLSNCYLVYLDRSITQINSLKNLNLDNNFLRELPEEIFSKIQLTHLSAKGNKLKHLPSYLVLSGSLQSLDLRQNTKLNTKQLFEYLNFMPQVKTLSIGPKNQIQKNARANTNIENIHLVKADVKNINEVLSSWAQLKSLRVTAPQTNKKEIELGLLKEIPQLESLVVNSSKAIKLNNASYKINLLETLAINSPKVVLPKLDSNTTPELSKLKIGNANFENVQLQIGYLPNLQKIELNNLENAPEVDFTKLPKLQFLDLSNANLPILAKNLSSQSPLQSIKLAGNLLSDAELQKIEGLFPNVKIQKETRIKELTPSIIQEPTAIKIKKQKNTMYSTINPSKEKSIVTKSNYKITIAPNSFIDEKGNPITEDVKLEITSYSNPLEFALAGIPMTVPEGKVTEFFSSSAMVAVKPASSNPNIRINPESPIKIELPVNRTTDTLYQLNENNGIWEKMEGNSLETINNVQLSNFIRDVNRVRFNRPIYPSFKGRTETVERLSFDVKRRKNQASFAISISSKYNKAVNSNMHKKFATKHQLKRYKWVYDGNSAQKTYKTLDSLSKLMKHYYTKGYKNKHRVRSSTKPALIRDITLSPDTANDHFLMTISIFNSKLIIPCYPELNVNNHATETQKIKHLYKSYKRSNKRKLKQWNKIEARKEADQIAHNKKLEKFQQLMAEYREKVAKYGSKVFQVNLPDSVLHLTAEELLEQPLNIPVSQAFFAASFGTFNEDVYYKINKPTTFKGNLLAENKVVKPNSIIIIDKSRAGTINIRWKNSFTTDSKSDVAIITELDNNRLGYVSSNRLKEFFLNPTKELKLDVVDRNTITYNELEKLL